MTALTALQAALAAEHAAVYGYGVIGAHLTGARQRRAQAYYDSHREQRDRLRRLVRDRDATPVAAAPAYSLPFDIRDDADAQRLAARVEDAAAAAYADLVAAATGDMRESAVQALRDAAVRAVAWRGSTVAFPGLTEVTGREATTPP